MSATTDQSAHPYSETARRALTAKAPPVPLPRQYQPITGLHQHSLPLPQFS